MILVVCQLSCDVIWMNRLNSRDDWDDCDKKDN